MDIQKRSTRNFIPIISISFCLFLLTLSPVSANEEKTNNDKSKTINVSIDPALSAAEKEYEKKLETLSPEQQELLAKLDDMAIQANEPQLSLISTMKKYDACAETNPVFSETHNQHITTFRYQTLDKMEAGWQKFNAERRTTDYNFIDPALLKKHLDFKRSMQTQLISGMGKVMADLITSNPDNTKKCNELQKELEGCCSKSYLEENTAEFVPFRAMKMLEHHSCSTGIQYMTANGQRISIAILFLKDGEESASFEISTKVFDSDQNTRSMQKAWIDFGNLNTRFVSDKIRPQPKTLIDIMPADSIIEALYHMREKGVVASAKTENWPEGIAFRVTPMSSAEADKMAGCVATLQPDYSDFLRDAGFSLPAPTWTAVGKDS